MEGDQAVSQIRIPPVLRQQTGGAKDVEIQGATVGELLQQLAERYPPLRDRLFADGALHRYVNVYLNDQDIQYLQKLDTPVAPEDTLTILPAMAGG
jgi:molybdopterin converting factor small subunit